jgi:hypothetical protein
LEVGVERLKVTRVLSSSSISESSWEDVVLDVALALDLISDGGIAAIGLFGLLIALRRMDSFGETGFRINFDSDDWLFFSVLLEMFGVAITDPSPADSYCDSSSGLRVDLLSSEGSSCNDA